MNSVAMFFKVVPRDISKATLNGNLFYKSSKQKWSSGLAINTGLMKPLKLKYNTSDAKTDFVVKNYNTNSKVAIIEGRNSFKGTVSVNVVEK